MMDIMKENQQNKERKVLSFICSMITIIAVCALVVIAAYLDLPIVVRIVLIIFAVITGAVGIGAACVLDVKAGYFECPHCRSLFVPTTGEYVKGYHTLRKRRLTCPDCGKTGMCRHRTIR